MTADDGALPPGSISRAGSDLLDFSESAVSGEPATVPGAVHGAVRSESEGSAGSERPVAALTAGAGVLRPLPARAVRLGTGFWGRRTGVNASRSLAAGFARLESSGVLENLRLAAGGAGTADRAYRGRLPFLDTDVFKWLEAVSWQLQQGSAGPWSAEEAADWSARAEEVIALVADAAAPDGYINSYTAVVRKGERWTDLAMGHELYCAGHLIQAGIAHRRATGRASLFDLARRFADLLVAEFGEGGRRVGYCGHPEVETALVELFRETGHRAYLDLAARFVDLRGGGLLGDRPFGRLYFQDVTPVRSTFAMHGHAVRALYLAAGVADVYLETGEQALLEALEAQWLDLLRGKAYITGGTGARHRDEAFGDAFELPSDRAYTETCAAIALMQWSWRMLLATGRAQYADMFERVLYNGFLSGVSLEGDRFFYVNPLQVRPDSTLGPDGRQEWFSCACCPPNVMRTLSSLTHYLATGDAEGIQVHQYAEGAIRRERGDGPGSMGVDVTTDYPFDGVVRLTVPADCAGEWQLSLRIPSWARGAAHLELDSAALDVVDSDGYARIRRHWQGGESLVLTLPVRPRLSVPDPRVDAVRGCAAVERGPLVYCFEQLDQHASLDEVGLLGPVHDADPVRIGDLEVPGVALEAETVGVPDESGAPTGWGYRALDGGASGTQTGVRLAAVPYFAWANRGYGAMRVWISLAGSAH
jgi:uncharacterized protein